LSNCWERPKRKGSGKKRKRMGNNSKGEKTANKEVKLPNGGGGGEKWENRGKKRGGKKSFRLIDLETNPQHQTPVKKGVMLGGTSW